MSTYRERRLARAEKLREWSEGRERKSAAARAGVSAIADQIPLGQPILVGHHSERRHRRDIEKIEDGMAATVEHGRKAQEMAQRADSIESQAATAIYSDDPDAVERLREKIAGLEAERDQIKAYNASCRKAAKAGGTGDLSLLSEKNRADLLSTAKCAGYMIGKGGAAPSYWLTNLGGNIRRLKGRLDDIESGRAERRASRDRTITARYGGTCSDCGAPIERGQQIRYSKAAGARCADCGEEE